MGQVKYEPMLRLKVLRVKKGLTQAELAEKVGIAQNVLSCYETGTCFPRRNTLVKLAEVLECEIADII